MTASSLSTLFDRDLGKLKSEIASFRRDENLWKTINGIINPSGNLCLHICGNLQHFVGVSIGSTGYQRDRDREFSARNVPRSKLIKEIDAAGKTVTTTLSGLDGSDLSRPMDFAPLGKDTTTELALIHLYGHMMWHLGQINYLRRILES